MAKTTRKRKNTRAIRRNTGIAAMPTGNFAKSKYYVHYEVESREWIVPIKGYIKKNHSTEDERAVNKLPDWMIGFGSHWATCAYYLLNDLPLPEPYERKFKERIQMLIKEGKAVQEEKKAEEKAEKKNVYKPSIQERISEQTQDACDAIEEWLEGYIVDPKKFDPKDFDFAGHFATHKITQAHARKIKKYYEGWLAEARLVADMPTPAQIKKIKDPKKADEAEQMREGYSHVKKADSKKWVNALENLIGACDLVIDSAKANRKPRTKKAPSKEKLVAKLKYKETDEKYQLASVNPLELIDCTEVWVFNTKTRKLGKYVVDTHATSMSVKGTTLVGFDENASIQKTLRKPQDTLKEFKKAGKVKLRKFLDEINTTDTKLNGRINKDTVILRVH